MIRRQIAPQEALIRLQTLCARAEHCESEMRNKLKAWGINEPQASEIIDRLIDEKFVDDLRFASSYVNDKLHFSHWGRRKIAQGLAAKRVSCDLMSQALDNIDPDEYLEILIAVIKSKARMQPELLSSYEGRTRLYRFCLQRGFESDVIGRAIKSLI